MKIKSIIALICTLAIALSMAVFADEVTLISETNENSIYVNGDMLDAAYVLNDADIMIPVRKVCEKLGFNVEWNAETNDVVVEKIPMYFTFNIYSDGYTIARTAPILLEKAPVLIDSITYVPVEFFSEIIKCDVVPDGNTINISMFEEKASNMVIFNGVEDNMCVVYDIKLGDVLVNISDNTVLSHNIEDFQKGQLVEVIYDDFMTMSIPPITNALELKMIEGETAELIHAIVVDAVSEEGINQLLIKDEAGMETALNISEETVLMNLDGEIIKLDSFGADTKISVVASMAATRSLPPQRAAYAVRIVE